MEEQEMKLHEMALDMVILKRQAEDYVLTCEMYMKDLLPPEVLERSITELCKEAERMKKRYFGEGE